MRTVLYMRMSTDKQEDSIPSQRKSLLEYAARNKYKIVGTYIDEGISGRTAEKRPSFMRMIDDSGKDMFDLVLVYDSSRFARNLEESIVYKSVLKRNGVKIISMTEPIVDDDTSLITDAMLGALNEMYSRKLSKSVKRGMTYHAQQGMYQTNPPFGYIKRNRVMSVVESEAAVVRNMFSIYLEKQSFHSIALQLNKSGISNRKGNFWDIRGIKRLLTNQTYIGNICYDGETYKGTHEPIIDIETWESVQEIINRRTVKRSRPVSTHAHWFTGILKCGVCGGRMQFGTNSQGCSHYRCTNHSYGLCTQVNFMSVKKLEKLMKHTLGSLVFDGNIDREYLVIRNDNSEMIPVLKDSLQKIRAKLERHKKAYAAGIDTIDEYKENKEQCALEELSLLSRISSLESQAISDESISSLRHSAHQLMTLLFSDGYSKEQKSLAIREIVDKIRFIKTTGEFSIYYFI